MEFRNLLALVEVVQQGGFSAAASVLFTSQSNVSKAVRQLEDELGVTLLDRNGHSSTLTDAGEIVFRRAQHILASSEDMMGELDELRGLRRGILRLGLPLFGSSVLFAPAFAQFRTLYPGIKITLVEHGSKRLEELLMRGEIDLAASLMPVSPEFEWQDVRNEQLVVLLQETHPFAGYDAVQLLDLHDEPFIFFAEDFALNQVIMRSCARRGFKPKVAARSGQIDFILGLARAGLGLAILPKLMADQRMRSGLTYVPLNEPGLSWHIGLIWRKGGYLPHAARAWLELVQTIHTEDE